VVYQKARAVTGTLEIAAEDCPCGDHHGDGYGYGYGYGYGFGQLLWLHSATRNPRSPQATLHCNFVYKNHFVPLIDALSLELFLVTALTF
jgi:hypothetical protein